jgi:hypothetical protein
VTSPRSNPVNCNPLVRLVLFRGRYRGAWRNAGNGDLLSHVWRPNRADHGDKV